MSTKPPRLKFETERLKDGPETHDLVLSPTVFELADDPDYRFQSDVTLKATLKMFGDTVLMEGEIAARVEAPCARCLEEIGIPVKAQYRLVFIQDPRLLETDRYPELVEDDTHYFDGESVQPALFLRELLLLELPQIPRCAPEDGIACLRPGGPPADISTFGHIDSEEPTRPNSFGEQIRKLQEKKNLES